MLLFIFSGLAVVITVFMIMARSNIRRWLGYANVVDITFTLSLIALFHGTFSGIVSAACAGIWMSVMLQIARKVTGVEKLRFKRTRWYKGFTGLHWVYIPPKELSFFGMAKKAT